MIASTLVPRPNDQEVIDLVTGFSETKGCVGTFNYTACSLRAATGKYTVRVDGDLTTVEDPGAVEIVKLANNSLTEPTTSEGVAHSTLAGLVAMLNLAWGSQVAAYRQQGQILYSTYLEPVTLQFQLGRVDGCSQYRDPLAEMLAELNKIAFYVGALAADEDPAYLETHMDPGMAQTQTSTTGYLVGDHNVYRTNYWWFLAAAVVEVVCILFIAPT